MGYEVHITRKTDWSDEGGSTISLDEWKELVERDPELRMENIEEGTAVWTAYPGRLTAGNMVCFHYFDGNLFATRPNEVIRQKMWQIAQVLGAKVQGDEGEEYDDDGCQIGGCARGFPIEDDGNYEPSPTERSRPWWKFW